MSEPLKPGIKYRHRYRVPPNKTVPSLHPESEEFLAMPQVFATGYLVGLLEWSCILAIKPFIDWPREQSVSTHIDVSHQVATPPGLEVTIDVELLESEDRKLVFAVEAHDGFDMESRGRHERFIIDKDTFDARVNKKAGQA
jgi:fluoroacetyl-CoA thioesterase